MIAAIVPAAGQSRRMGRPKGLLPLAGTTVIGHIVDQLRRSRVDEICVVVGHRADDLRRALAQRPVRIVENPDYRRGDMLASIRCGLAALPAECQAIVVALGDQPAISAEVVDALVAAWDRGARGIVVPVYAGRRGHPLLLAARYREEIRTEHDGVGLRGLLAAHAGEVLEVPVPGAGVLSDMDDREDYRRELGRYR